MVRTSILLSFLTAMLGNEAASLRAPIIQTNSAPVASQLLNDEPTENQRIMDDARKSVGAELRDS